MATTIGIPTWAALPATFITTIITDKILKTTIPPKEKCLLIISKAFVTFLVVLAITLVTIKIRSYDLSYTYSRGIPVRERPNSLAEELTGADVSDAEASVDEAPPDDRIVAWPVHVRDAQPPSDSVLAKYRKDEDIETEEQEVRKLQKKTAEEKKESKKIWRALVKEFKPKRKELLGGRKEAKVEVVESSEQ